MVEPINILYIDDNPLDRALVRDALENESSDFRLSEAASRAEFERLLAEGVYDLVLSDFNILGFEGLQVIDAVQAQHPDLPVVIVTGTGSEEIVIEAMRRGAADYVIKTPRHIQRLPFTIQAVLEKKRLRQEREQMAQALRASEAELRALFEAMTDLIFVLDADGRYLKVAPTNPALLYRPAEDLLGQTVQQVLPQAEADLRLGAIRQALATGQSVTIEYSLPIGGQETWFSAVISPMTAETVVFVARDITERKLVEERLAEERNLLRTLIDNLPDYIYIKDTEGHFILGNRAVAQLVGAASPDDLVGKTDFDLYPQELAEQYFAHEQSVLRTGQPIINQEEPLLDSTGKKGWVLTTQVPLRDNRGQVVGLVGMGRDITERRNLEEQFRQAQKMEAVGLLAGGVAHDFNNMLVVINGYSEILLKRYLAGQEAERKYVEEIKKAGERAAGLTRQLLAFSRQQVMQPQLLNLNEIVLDLEKMLRRLIGEDIDLKTRLEPNLGLVKADPGQLEQVVVNLVVNARDAMPRGGWLILETANIFLDEAYTRLHANVAAGSYTQLTVSDTGHGMDAATQARIFEPFFTTKEQGKGTGLGLATVYGIVTQSGGHIQVYSEVGQGTTFKVYLPQAQMEEGGLAAPAPTPLLEGTETILLVEDEEMVLDLARRVLLSYGYTVLEAGHGPAALQLAKQYPDPIHLLLTDVVMPGAMNGRELAERLTALRPEMRVLYMSGYTDDTIVRHGLLEAGLFFLQKPFSPSTLARRVREVLDG